jgi:hypothetical protein
MSDQYDEFAPGDSEGDTGGALRTKLEAAIKQLREKDKQLSELQQERTKRTLNDLLTKAEVPAKFHKLAEKTLGSDLDETAFNGFLEEYGDLWGADPEKKDELSPEDAELAAGLNKIDDATRQARNIKAEGFKMPSAYDLARMKPNELAALAEQARGNTL